MIKLSSLAFALVVITACSSGPTAVTPTEAKGLPPVGAVPASTAGTATTATTASPIATTPASAAPAAPAASYVGVVTTRESKVVVAEFEGRLESMSVHSGQTVRAGDEIAKLDASQLAKQVEVAASQEASARSAAAQASIQHGEAKRTLALEARLEKGGASTPEAVRQARAAVASTGAAASAAHNAATAAAAEHSRLAQLLAHATLTAPLDGVVSTIRVKEGELAVPGTPIARIFDPQDRWIRFAMPEDSRDDSIAIGSKIEVTVPSTSKSDPPVVLTATVATVSNVMEPPLQLVVVEADLDDSRPETALAEIGKTVDVRRMP